ncbi:MAG: hypothetical protein GY832_10170 [Chloroflexi bacterium]|nr:hypothetical protein [Chloroflexota bacterium]
MKKRQVFSLIIVLFGLAFFPSTGASLSLTPDPTTYIVSGRVTLLNTENPLADVTIQLQDGQSGVTNSQGEFTFNLPDGEYVLTPEKTGYSFRPKASESIVIPPAQTEYHFIAVEYKWPWKKDETLRLTRTWHGLESGWDGIDFYTGDITAGDVANVLAMNDGFVTGTDICTETVTDSSAPGGQRNVATIRIRQNDDHYIYYLHLNADTIPSWIESLEGSNRIVSVVQGQYLGDISAGSWSGSCAGGQYTALQNNSQGHVHIDVPNKYLLVEGWELLHAESQSTCFTSGENNLCPGTDITSNNPKVECDAIIGTDNNHNGSTLCRKYTVVKAVGTYNEEIGGTLQRVAPVYSNPVQRSIVGWVREGALGLVICRNEDEAFGCPNIPRAGEYYWRVAWVEDSFVALDPNGEINEAYWVREDDFREFTSSDFPDVFFGQTHFPDIAIVAAQRLFRGFSDGEFKRERAITRGETAVAIARWLLKKNIEGEDITCADIQLGTSDGDVTCTGNVPTQYTRFNDIGSDNWLSQNDRGIEYLRQNAYVNGFSPENCTPAPASGFTCYKPDNDITRAEFTTVIMRVFEKRYDEIEGSGAYDQLLASLPSLDRCDFGTELDGSPHKPFIDDACKLEIVKGYSDGTFRPDEPIQRQQGAKVIGRAYLYMVDPTDFAANSLRAMSVAGELDFAVSSALLQIREPNRVQLPNPPTRPSYALYLPLVTRGFGQQPPATPSNLQATALDSTRIQLTWTDNSDNETGFYIYSSGDHVATAGPNTTSHIVTGLTPDTQYCYYVTAFNDAGQSISSTSEDCATTLPISQFPNAPSNLAVSDTTQDSITWTWQDNSNNEDGFKIYRWNGTEFQYWASVGANITTFADTGLDCGSGYAYEVSAYNSSGESAHAPWVEGSTDSCSNPPATPSNLQARALDSTRIELTWTDNSNNEDGFHIYDADYVATVGPNTTSYIITGLDSYTQYCHHIFAYNDDGVSSWTDWACDTTLFRYFDNFGDSNSGWPNDPSGGYSYQSGEYQIANSQANSVYGVVVPTVGSIDYTIEADMRLYSGDPIRYGLIFDWLDWNNYYVFSVNPTAQNWSLQKVDNGIWVTIDDGDSSYVNYGSATNHLEVQRLDQMLQLMVNGNIVKFCTTCGDAFAGDLRAGLFAKSGNDVPVTARFDNFLVEEIR